MAKWNSYSYPASNSPWIDYHVISHRRMLRRLDRIWGCSFTQKDLERFCSIVPHMLGLYLKLNLLISNLFSVLSLDLLKPYGPLSIIFPVVNLRHSLPHSPLVNLHFISPTKLLLPVLAIPATNVSPLRIQISIFFAPWYISSDSVAFIG